MKRIKETNINSLLDKGNLTGLEVAQVVLEDWALLYQELQENGEPKRKPITAEEKKTLIDKIKSEEEYEEYLKFMKLKNWITDTGVVLSVYKQQCFRIYAELEHKLITFSICERINNIIECFPRIESQRKNDLFLKKKVKEVMESKEELNYFLLLKETLNWYNILKEKNQRRKNPLNDLKKVLSKERIKAKGYKTNKWDVISRPNSLHNIFACFEYPVNKEKEKEYLKAFEVFKREFKPVYEFLIQEIAPYYPEILTLKDNEWLNSIGTYKDLEKKNFFNVPTLIINNDYLLYDNDFDKRNGVAIINKNSSFDIRKDLEMLKELGNNMDTPLEIEDTKKSIETLKYSLYFIKGFNTAMDIISETYKLPAIKDFKIDLSGLKEYVKDFNRLVDEAFSSIEDSSFYTNEEMEKRKTIIKKSFEKIDFNSLKAPRENIIKAKEVAKDISFTETPYFINLVGDIETKV